MSQEDVDLKVNEICNTTFLGILLLVKLKLSKIGLEMHSQKYEH